MEHVVTVLELERVTYDTRRVTVEKPPGYSFIPGQATEVALNRTAWREEKRPFSFTNLDQDKRLEFIIKIYADHDGVTRRIGELSVGDELIIEEPFGTISYKGEGYFIAGGAGITPFIAILRQLWKHDRLGENMLLYSNKTEREIILENELSMMLGPRAVYNLTHEPSQSYNEGLIDESYLRQYVHDFSRYFYVCGPEAMVKDMMALLTRIGAPAQSIIFEE